MTTAIPRCETCANFRPPVAPLIYGECAAIVDVWCAGALNASTSWLEEIQTALLPCAAIDDHCLHLHVMPTFGCTLHVPKAEP